MPTISVYAPNNDEIDEIRMVFDNHGYQDRFHELFRELCICMEKMLMPELSMAEAETLFETLYAQSDDNFFGDHSAFDDPQRPPLNAVYQDKNIGMIVFTDQEITDMKNEKNSYDVKIMEEQRARIVSFAKKRRFWGGVLLLILLNRNGEG